MLNPDSAEWRRWNIEAPLHKFFTLHWAELFDENTVDTWQVRTCNINVLMGELRAAAAVAKHLDSYRWVLHDLIAESVACASRDAVIRRFYPFVLAYLEPWKNKKLDGTDIDRIGRLAAAISGNLSDYRARATALVRDLLRSECGKRKSDLYEATMSLAIEVSRAGYSTEYLTRVFQATITAESSEAFLSRFDRMMASLSGEQHEYFVTFLPKGVRHSLGRIALPEDIKVTIGLPAPLSSEPEEEFYGKGNAYSVFVTIRATATDPVSARHVAGQRLSDLFAAMNVYGVQCDFQLTIPRALVRGPENEFELVAPSESRNEYLRNTKGVHGKAAKLLSVLSRPGSPDSAHLVAALQYHRLSLTSTGDEARFVNLWVGVESLCQGHEGSIIDRVCARLAPSVALGNVRKLLTSLAIYIRSFWWNDDGRSAALLRLFPNSKTEALRPEDLLTVLLQPEDGEQIAELFKLVSEHPLLCYRLHRVRARLLADANAVAKALKQHRQNVEWQLRRIYRVRNEILHSGKTVPYLRQLIQHLHTYLLVTVQALAYELRRQPNWTIPEALEHRRLLFEHAVRALEASEPDGISQKALLDLALLLGPQEPPHAWPSDGRKSLSSE